MSKREFDWKIKELFEIDQYLVKWAELRVLLSLYTPLSLQALQSSARYFETIALYHWLYMKTEQ